MSAVNATLSPAEVALAELHTRQRELNAGMADLVAKVAKMNATSSQGISEARAELDALGAAEAEAASKWAAAGASGLPPTVDMEARAELVKRLATAEARAHASNTAVKALEARHNEWARQANELAVPISAAVVAIMVDRLEAETVEAKSLIEKLLPLMGKLDGRRYAAMAEARSHAIPGHLFLEQMRRLHQIPTTQDLMRGDPQPIVVHHFAAEIEALKRGDAP